jgi:hypothetical protein
MHYLEEMVSLQGVLKSIFYLIVELSYCSVLEVYQATLETCLDLKSVLFFLLFSSSNRWVILNDYTNPEVYVRACILDLGGSWTNVCP